METGLGISLWLGSGLHLEAVLSTGDLDRVFLNVEVGFYL